MLSVCPLLTVCILGALGTASKKDRDSTKERVLSDLQLLLPIEYIGQPKSKDVYPKSESPGRLGLLSDGPYSRLPASEFSLDEDLFPPIHSSHKKIIKKDLSRTNPFPIKRTVHPPTDLAGSCLNYLLQRNLGELGGLSDTQNKQPINEIERELLSTLCKKYLGKIYVEDGETSIGKGLQNGFFGNSVGQGVGGEAVNMGIGGQGIAGNVLAVGKGGLMRDVGIGGQGQYAKKFQVNKNRVYADNGLVSGFGQNGGFEAEGRGVFTAGKGIDHLYNALGVIGNVGLNGLGGYAGNFALDGLGSQTGNAGISGQGGVAGNAAFNGYGGLAGNVGVKGTGGKAGNLGEDGKGGLFGNLGIGGQGGFFGNVGIGTAGSQYVDFYQEPDGNILNHLPGFAANRAPSNQKVSSGYVSGQNGKEADLIFDGSSASHVVLEHGSSAPAQGSVELLTVSLVADGSGAGLENQAAVGTANSKTDGVSGNTANADSELVDMQRVPKDKGQSQKITATTNNSQVNKQGDSKAVARNQEGQKSSQCLIGSLAYGGQGGQVGNLMASGVDSKVHYKATPGTVRDEHCAHCLHVYYVGARSDAARADQDPGSSAALTPPDPPQSAQEPAAVAADPLVPSSKFRPPGSRRNWMVIDDRHIGKLRQYINSKKPWLLI